MMQNRLNLIVNLNNLDKKIFVIKFSRVYWVTANSDPIQLYPWNAVLNFIVILRLRLIDCFPLRLFRANTDRRQTSYSNGQDSEVEEINQGLPGTNSAGGQYRT